MSGSSSDSELTGAELLSVANSANTRQFKDVPIDELAQWLKDQDLPADVVMISLLSDIKNEFRRFDDIKDLLKEQNKILRKMYQ